MCSYGPPHMAGKKQEDKHEHIFSSYEWIKDIALKTCQMWWTIGKSGERGSGISLRVARQDDDDDDDDFRNIGHITFKWVCLNIFGGDKFVWNKASKERNTQKIYNERDSLWSKHTTRWVDMSLESINLRYFKDDYPL